MQLEDFRKQMNSIVLLNLAATLLMVGIIWFVQVVHYPLYTRISVDSFPRYEVDHIQLVTLVVGPTMLIEAGTALLMLVSPPPQVPLWVLLFGLALVGVVWATTVFIHVPQHNALSNRFDETVHSAMIMTNWIRTVAWSVRGVLMLWVVSRMLG